MAQTMNETKTMKTENMNMFQMASDSFRTAMDAGMKFQKDAFEAMNKMFCGGEMCCDMQGKMEETTTNTVNVVRKNAEQTQKMFDENCRNGLTAIRKSFEAARENDKDMMTRATNIWSCAFDAMRGNVEATAKTATQTIENWSEFMTKTMKNGTDKPTK